MILETGIEGLLVHETALVVVVHPLGELVVPDKTMPPHLDAVLPTEVGDAKVTMAVISQTSMGVLEPA